MSKRIQVGIDGSVAALLALVLLLVYFVDGSGQSRPDDDPGDDGRHPITTVLTPPPKARLAITPGTYDRMGPLLERLGEGYRFEEIEEAKLADPAECRRFDAIFLTCTAGSSSDEAGKGKSDALAAALRGFVEGGGTLYASDLQFGVLEKAFREYVDRKSVAFGLKSDRVDAAVVDPDLGAALGSSTMSLHFDQEGWRPASFGGEGKGVTIFLQGRFPIVGSKKERDAPLLVKFRHGQGTVIFTSFHNEKANPGLEPKLLEYLVLSTVTARVEAQAMRELASGGFSPKVKSLLSASSDDAERTQTFDHAKTGRLKFVLGFEDRGATLRLKVVSPDGKEVVKTGGSTLTIEVPDAMPGPWSYSVAAESVPYPKFAYTLSVGEPAEEQVRPIEPMPGRPGNGLDAAKVAFKIVPVGERHRARAGPPKIGVTRVQLDDMGKLLKSLGSGYTYEGVSDDDLLNPTALSRFDILFLTCGALPGEWFERTIGKSERDGYSVGPLLPDKKQQLGDSIRHFVERGGTLYASDLRANLIFFAFPGRHPRYPRDLAMLRYVDAAERELIKAKAPKAGVGTIAEALRKARLSPQYKEEEAFKNLVASVEISRLVGDGLSGNRANSVKLVHDALPDVDPNDATAIIEALTPWDQVIRRGNANRTTKRKADAEQAIQEAENHLRICRDRIRWRGAGAAPQAVSARIVDPGLRDALKSGDSISLNFDKNGWEPARFAGEDVTRFLEGDFQQTLGPDDRDHAPLLVKFSEGEGTVIFTSFHNENVNSELEAGLLRYLVFAAITAKDEEATVTEISKGGFSPAKRSLGSHSPGTPSVSGSYRSTRPGPVRFALTLGGEGASMKFTLMAPNGQVFEQVTSSTLIVEASGAPVGEWTYTVTSLHVPFDNFPWGVSVGETTDGPKPR